MAPTIETVREAFKAMRAAIAELDDALADERRQLKLRAFRDRRPLTPAEIQRRKEIAATRLELAEALSELGLNTLEALDNASDVDDLLNEINAVNQQLEDDLEHLKTIEGYAEVAANVAEMLSRAVTALTQLRPTFI